MESAVSSQGALNALESSFNGRTPVRVHFLDNTSKVFLVDKDSTARSLLKSVLGKIGITASPDQPHHQHLEDFFGLYESLDGGKIDSPLEPGTLVAARLKTWTSEAAKLVFMIRLSVESLWGLEDRDKVAKRLDKGNAPESLDLEQYLANAGVRDQSMIHLQYIQAMYNVITSQYTTTEEQALKLGALHFQFVFGAFSSAVHKEGFLGSRIVEFVPIKLLRVYDFDEWESRLYHTMSTSGASAASGREHDKAFQLRYLLMVVRLPEFGSAFYKCTQTGARALPETVFLGVQHDGIKLYSKSRKPLMSLRVENIQRWGFKISPLKNVVAFYASVDLKALPAELAKDLDATLDFECVDGSSGKAIADLLSDYANHKDILHRVELKDVDGKLARHVNRKEEAAMFILLKKKGGLEEGASSADNVNLPYSRRSGRLYFDMLDRVRAAASSHPPRSRLMSEQVRSLLRSSFSSKELDELSASRFLDVASHPPTQRAEQQQGYFTQLASQWKAIKRVKSELASDRTPPIDLAKLLSQSRPERKRPFYSYVRSRDGDILPLRKENLLGPSSATPNREPLSVSQQDGVLISLSSSRRMRKVKINNGLWRCLKTKNGTSKIIPRNADWVWSTGGGHNSRGQRIRRSLHCKLFARLKVMTMLLRASERNLETLSEGSAAKISTQRDILLDAKKSLLTETLDRSLFSFLPSGNLRACLLEYIDICLDKAGPAEASTPTHQFDSDVAEPQVLLARQQRFLKLWGESYPTETFVKFVEGHNRNMRACAALCLPGTSTAADEEPRNRARSSSKATVDDLQRFIETRSAPLSEPKVAQVLLQNIAHLAASAAHREIFGDKATDHFWAWIVRSPKNHPSSAVIACWGCAAICELADNHEYNSVRLGAAGAVETVVQALRNHSTDESVAEQGFLAIVGLQLYSETNKVRLARCSACSVLVDTLALHALKRRESRTSSAVAHYGCVAINLLVDETGYAPGGGYYSKTALLAAGALDVASAIAVRSSLSDVAVTAARDLCASLSSSPYSDSD